MKTAVVTGISYGIGKSIAEALLGEGWKIYGLSRSKPTFTSEQFVWLKCDLSKPDEITDCLQYITEPMLDALISNAGVVKIETASAVSSESYNQTFSVNVLAPMLLVNALLPKITYATIVSVSSVSDRLPEAKLALYCSSKAANTLYFRALAQELKDAKVYTLLPDYVETPMLHSTEDETNGFDWSATIQPNDIAKLTVNLVSARTKLDTGATIIIVTEALKESLKSNEILYGFNTDSSKLDRL
jgi:NAD(P)-dependent dehydrogenase (short-subunit alcohol dehydrogenase family)